MELSCPARVSSAASSSLLVLGQQSWVLVLLPLLAASLHPLSRGAELVLGRAQGGGDGAGLCPRQRQKRGLVCSSRVSGWLETVPTSTHFSVQLSPSLLTAFNLLGCLHPKQKCPPGSPLAGPAVAVAPRWGRGRGSGHAAVAGTPRWPPPPGRIFADGGKRGGCNPTAQTWQLARSPVPGGGHQQRGLIRAHLPAPSGLI